MMGNSATSSSSQQSSALELMFRPSRTAGGARWKGAVQNALIQTAQFTEAGIRELITSYVWHNPSQCGAIPPRQVLYLNSKRELVWVVGTDGRDSNNIGRAIWCDAFDWFDFYFRYGITFEYATATTIAVSSPNPGARELFVMGGVHSSSDKSRTALTSPFVQCIAIDLDRLYRFASKRVVLAPIHAAEDIARTLEPSSDPNKKKAIKLAKDSEEWPSPPIKRRIASLPAGRIFAAAVTVNGYVCVVGGIEREFGAPVLSTACYDPGTDQWESISSAEARLITGRARPLACSTPGGRVVIAGGERTVITSTTPGTDGGLFGGMSNRAGGSFETSSQYIRSVEVLEWTQTGQTRSLRYRELVDSELPLGASSPFAALIVLPLSSQTTTTAAHSSADADDSDRDLVLALVTPFSTHVCRPFAASGGDNTSKQLRAWRQVPMMAVSGHPATSHVPCTAVHNGLFCALATCTSYTALDVASAAGGQLQSKIPVHIRSGMVKDHGPSVFVIDKPECTCCL